MRVDEDGFVNLEWLSMPGCTYFMQCSFDLISWTFFGEVIHSGFGIERVTFDPADDDHLYFRIICVEIPTYDAANDDFDGDGITNADEVATGTNPLVAQPGSNPIIVNSGLVTTHTYTLEVTQTGGSDAGTRKYHLNRDYELLDNVPNETHHPFPIPIAAKPNGVTTTLTFKSVNSVDHDTPIDLIFYKLEPDPALPPGSSAPPIPGLEKIPPLIIPKDHSSVTSSKVFHGSNLNQGVLWHVAPLVVRGIDQTPDSHVVGSWDSGVDKTSRRAAVGDVGAKTDTWIMAPGGAVNQVEIEANAPFPLDFTCDVATLAPALLQTPKATISVAATVANGEINENHAPIKLGIPGSAPRVEISTCVRAKSVKRREITVNVYPITSSVPGRQDFPPLPQLTEQDIQDYLDRVYLPQANLKCQVELHPISVVAWDTTETDDYNFPFNGVASDPEVGDLTLDVGSKFETPDQTALYANKNFAVDEIHLFLVGGCNEIRQLALTAQQQYGLVFGDLVGLALIDDRSCFVAANKIHPNLTELVSQNIREFAKSNILNTMAHEIGHIIILHGHPDSYDPTNINPDDQYAHNGGVAPLARDPALHERRLMASGLLRKQGIELVLDEWSQIIKRLNVINPTSNNGN